MNNEQKKVALVSLGCAKNLVDSEYLLGGLIRENFLIEPDPGSADIIIINTCGFLDTAREESVNVILEAGELRQSGTVEQLVVMGCFAERYGTELRRELPEVDAIFGTHDQAKIISYLTGRPHVRDDPDFFRSLLTPNHYAYLKITEGCDNGCSFCSIPLMRGKQISQPIDHLVKETQYLVDRGVREVLIIGQDTTSYGWDLPPGSTLHALLQELNAVPGLDWLRLHYAHPAHLHRGVIQSFSELDKLVPYIDMPVQHGSDKLLRRMRRGLNAAGIMKRISALRDAHPRMAIRTSIIVGFPGETDNDFAELMNMVDTVRFDRLGVFTYSEEEGTHGAEAWKDDVSDQLKYDRMDTVMLRQQEISLENNMALVGRVENVLVDSHTEDDFSIARTYRDSPEVDNIVRINGILPVGEFTQVRFTAASEYELTAEIVES